MRQFDFAILGAGALGSILGAHLARAGHSVVMLVRESRARQIDSLGGLCIRGLSDFTQPVATLVDTSTLSSAGVLVVAMKLSGTEDALATLRNAQIDSVFSIQNGLAKNELLTTAFGAERVLGSLANTSGELLPSGEVLFTRNVNLLLGGLASEHEKAQRIASLIDAAGVRSMAVPDIISREWSKFAAWAGFMILSVTVRAPTWKYLMDRDSAWVLARIVREIGALAAAIGVPLTDDSLLPVASMCSGAESAAIDAVIEAGRDFKSRAPGHRMSSLQDLEAGRALEVEALGYAVEKATALGLELPLLVASHRLVASIDRNRG